MAVLIALVLDVLMANQGSFYLNKLILLTF